jgi:flavin-dependent dehydrogenase
MATPCDVIVFGGGVDGCATALALQRQGLRAVVLERSAGSAARVGEHLAPDAWPLLSRLGLGEAFLADRHRRSPGVRSSWGDAGISEREYIFNPYGDGWNLDRARFDASLATTVLVAGGAMYGHAHTGTIGHCKAGWLVETAVGSERRAFTAAFLVDATGRAAAIARRLGARHVVHDRLIGIMGVMKSSDRANVSDATLLIEAVADGWWYTALLPDRRLLAAFMTDMPVRSARADDLTSMWSTQMERTRYIQVRAAGFELDGDVRAKFAGSAVCEPAAGNRWIAVADAASAFDPLSSMGITRALQSAIVAADVIERSLSGDTEAVVDYAARIAREFDEYLTARTLYYCRETRWRDRPFWSGRHNGVMSHH